MKRAETSETRPAPLVTTTMLMIIRIMNTNSPTAKLPPTRNAPKASITCPAAAPPSCPLTSTTRVDATLSARRSSVANSRTEGNELKSSGFSAFIAAIRIATDSAMLSTKNTSSSSAGVGTTIKAISVRIPAGSAKALIEKRESIPLTARMPEVCHRPRGHEQGPKVRYRRRLRLEYRPWRGVA